MLHVTNGDATLVELKRAGLEGDFLPWRDALHEGPVPRLAPAELRAVRARFLTGGRTDERTAAEEMAARDDRLSAALASREPVVLWFEHDLYDQLQLIQILDRVDVPEGVALIQSEVHLGALSARELAALWPSRTPVSARQVAEARAAWEAFRGDDPRELARLAGARDGELPFLAPALRRQLEELPGAGDGLTRTERQLLEAIAGGARTPAEAFMAGQAREEALFLGDLYAFHRLEELAAAERPLLAGSREHPELTADGEAVLEGHADRVVLCGFDRRIGGLNLVAGDNLWRWDRSCAVPVRD